jgi:cytosine/adenosine deaminase-related metal-dependent hydrolase
VFRGGREMKIYHNAVIISMDKNRSIWENGAIAIDGTRIVEVGKTEEILEAYPQAEKIDVKNNLILPGLINCHVHTAQAMLRGMADDLDLMPMVMERFWPLQAQYSPKEGELSANLCLLEMLLSGTTTFVEAMLANNYGLDGVAKAILNSGMRGVISKIVMETLPGSLLPSGLAENRKESFAEAKSAYKNWHGYDEKLQIWLAPRWTGSFNPSLLEEVASVKDEYNMKITMHFAESKEDTDIIRQQTGLEPVSFLKKMEVAGPDMLLIHGTYLSKEDIDVMAETKTRLAHCPLSNMKIAMGYANVPLMLEKDVVVGLGTDGGPCNNNYDMFLEMRAAAMLHKDRSGDSKIVPAEKALEMATIDAAKALGMEKEIGSLEAGKKADFIIINLDQPHLTPSLNPVSTVVYAAKGSDVKTVIIDGKEVVKEGKILTIDLEKVLFSVKEISPKLIANIGISKQDLTKWPVIS